MRRSVRLLLGAFLLAVVGAGFAPVPATAASGYCSGAGISVVVDPGALGGGVQRACAGGSGSRSAASAFAAAGVSLTRVSRFPGAICKVDGRPSASCTNMPPGDAYWGLFWSDGSGWSFSSQGVDSLHLSSGDTVAFAWQTGSKHPPAAAPAAPARSTPTVKPTSSGSTKGGSRGSTSSPSGAVLPKDSSSPTDHPSHKAHVRASPTPSPTTTTSASAGEAYSSNLTITKRDPAEADDSGGLPWWVPVGIVVVLAAGGAGAVVARRRSGNGAG